MKQNQEEESKETISVNNDIEKLFEVNQQTKEENCSDNNNNNISPPLKDKRRRRSKKDLTERNFACPQCNKRYLSGPALSSHKKEKHNKNQEKKGRGRPKKYPDISLKDEKELDEFNNFFKNIKRLPSSLKDHKQFDLKELLTTTMNDINHSKSLPMIGNNKIQETLYQYCIEINKRKEDKKSAEDAIIRYLNEFKNQTNIEYYKKMIKFLVLLLEFYYQEEMNEKEKMKKKEEEKKKKEEEKKKGILIENALNEALSKEDNDQNKVTKKNKAKSFQKNTEENKWNAEKLPELCNNFMSNDRFALIIDVIDEYEAMALMLHFCCWLNLEGYSSTLIALN